MIAAITPSLRRDFRIQRGNFTSEDIAAVGRVNIHNFTSDYSRFRSMSYEILSNTNEKDPTSHFDLLWKVAPILGVQSPIPGIWNDADDYEG